MEGRVSQIDSALLLARIHRSAWNRNSAKFAFWGFSEVRGSQASMALCSSEESVETQLASAIPARRLPIMRIITGLLIVALAMLVAVGGLVLVQRLFSTERRKQHNDVAGFIYAVLGVAYAVLLGLMLIAVWEK